MSHLFEYRGHKVFLDASHAFVVEGPHLPGDRERFASAADARTAIDTAVSVAERAGRVRVSIEVQDEKGEDLVITGIHRSTQEILGTSLDVYPRNPWLKTSLKRMAELEKELMAIKQVVYKFAIKRTRGFGRIKTPARYDDAINDLTQEVAKKTELLEQHLAGQDTSSVSSLKL